MTFVLDMKALRERASKRGPQQGYPATRLPEPPAKGSRVAKVAGYPASEEADAEAFDERAAIMEFDGGLPRAEAEVAARQCVDCEPGAAASATIGAPGLHARDVGRDLASLLQRCPGFQSVR